MILSNGIYIKFFNISILKNNVHNIFGESAIQISNFFFIFFDHITISQCFSTFTTAGVKIAENYKEDIEGKVKKIFCVRFIKKSKKIIIKNSIFFDNYASYSKDLQSGCVFYFDAPKTIYFFNFKFWVFFVY